MAQAPKHVRLADHMVHGLVVDMDTGWSISGYDVQEVPEDQQQRRYIVRKINAGVLEPATEAEYNEAHPAEETDADAAQAQAFVDAVKAASRNSGQQEHKIRERESKGHEAVRRARTVAKLQEEGVDVDDDASLDEAEWAAEEARLAALAEEQEEEGITTDDPEQQGENTATRAPKKAAAKKAAPRRRSS